MVRVFGVKLDSDIEITNYKCPVTKDLTVMGTRSLKITKSHIDVMCNSIIIVKLTSNVTTVVKQVTVSSVTMISSATTTAAKTGDEYGMVRLR